MKKQKIKFSKLLGNHYPIEVKMMVLDWMLHTGRKHRQRLGRWDVIGISKWLFDYSANDFDDGSKIIPESPSQYSEYFDAIFARAVFKQPNKAVVEWRSEENITCDSYRMLNDIESVLPFYDHRTNLYLAINSIYEFAGCELKSEYAHPDKTDRTTPKIISVKIYTTGNGWVIEFVFSFIEYNYEPGWTTQFRQEKSDSVSDFINKTYLEIKNRIYENDKI